jgi:hypothetical protein
VWVIPCKYDPEHPVIFDCVKSIISHHPDAHIVVVDSASEDKSYFKDLKAWDVTVADVNNQFYGPGAFSYAYDTYLDEDFFYCIFDSLIINDNLEDLEEFDCTSIRHFFHPPTGWGWNEDTGQPLEEWARAKGVRIPKSYIGVMGPMLIAQRKVFRSAGLFKIMPTNRYEQCALERCWGIWLQQAEYDPTNSLQGEMHGFFDDYPEDRVTKLDMHRT